MEKLRAEAKADLAKAKAQDAKWDNERDKQVNKIFEDYDSDNSGVISGANFREAIVEIVGEWDERLYGPIFRKLDSSGDGTLNKKEMSTGLAMIDAAKIFDGMDTDNSGVLSQNQWTTVAMKTGFNAADAEKIFIEFDDDGNGFMDFEEFLDCMQTLQGVFLMNDIQTRIDATKAEIQDIEKKVSGLLSEITGHTAKKDKAEKRRDAHAAEKAKKKAVVDEHLAFFGEKTTLVEGHREHLDVLSMSMGELKSKFAEYKRDMHQAFGNKQWDVCKELADELDVIKYELDEQTGKHTLALQAHADQNSVIESKTVDHAQADIELRHLHDLLAEAEAHHDEIAAAHGGALQELRQYEARYEELKDQLKELEEEGARGGLGNAMGKLDKQLELVAQLNRDVLALCDHFAKAFSGKRWAEIGVIGKKLGALDAKADRAEKERNRLLKLVEDKKGEMDHIDGRNKMDSAHGSEFPGAL